MYLKSIELSGFKSFAKKVVIEFKSPITAIVGPNGSGKSNVAEGFRFVLGEQSIKSMRGKKGEDLIWNGSEAIPKSNRAVVKAVFDNRTGLFSGKGAESVPVKNLDYDEVSIERVVNRDGANEYSVNGTQVRLKDVIELLAGAHIGASGHHIISQGEADRILTASVKERREMLEDALGLKVYQYKKQESQRKLLKTFENISQVESLRREIAPHLRFLKKQVEKVSRAEGIRDKLVSLYREYLKREKVYIEKTKDALQKEKHPLEKKLEEFSKMNEKAKETLERSEKRDSKSDELLRIENELKTSRERKDVLEREAGRIEGEVNANRRLIEKAIEKARGAEHKTILLKDLEDLEREISGEITKTMEENAIDVLKKVFLSIREKLSKFIEKNRGVSEESRVEEIKQQNEELQKKIAEIDLQINKEKEITDKLESSYSEIRTVMEKEKDSSREAEKELFRISSERSSVESELYVIKSKEDRLRIEETDFLREAEEGNVLLRESIVGFASEEIKDHTGRVLEDEEIANEERKLQEDRRREIEKIKIRLEEMGSAGGEEVMKEFKETSERDAFLERELNDLHTSSESLKQLITELEERLNVEFKEGIGKINKAFNDFFSIMFGGGSAKLEVVERSLVEVGSEEEEEQNSEDGIDISVSLPKKKIKGLVMLSGGERALTSIALLFAISQVNPPPFVILDETDAALDEANSKKYGDMIESLSKFSQLILITHNRETMSRAGVIYGVTMGGSGISKLLSIAFDEAIAAAK